MNADEVDAALTRLSTHLDELAARHGEWKSRELAALCLVHGYEKAADVLESSLQSSVADRLDLLAALRTVRLYVINALESHTS